ncbi:hypothetical protein BC834DRAFT_974223 [Gloeopeniophorella convolvens]|nr:hypothetical protein BC834DRAFT_974223 [Gloeopeniophorella convolvens]
MAILARISTLLAFALAAHAYTLCASPQLLASTTLDTGAGLSATYQKLCCYPPPPPAEPTTITTTETLSTTATITTTSVVAAPTPSGVCGEICNNQCSRPTTGPFNLPPTTDDCSQITDAIQIFEASTGPNFTVQPGGIETLTFGTCTYTFENLSEEPLSYCWSDFANVGSVSGEACFPPVMPLQSQATCTAVDRSWSLTYVPRAPARRAPSHSRARLPFSLLSITQRRSLTPT